MRALLPWIIPPLAGAFIGYVTNAIAIRMLFRPLKTLRLFGLRLPFTPGILPRHRHKLAENIGAMVERELLTPEILSARFRREDVRERITGALAEATEQILAMPLKKAAPFIIPQIKNLLRSPGANSLLEGLFPALPNLANPLSRILEDRFPAAAASLVEFLKTGEMRGILEHQGRIFLNKAILKLSGFQRFLVSAAQYDRTLHEQMPAIIDDLILQLENLLAKEEIRWQLLILANASLRSILAAEETRTRIQDLFRRRLAVWTEEGALEGFFEKHRDLRLGDLFGGDKQRLDALICDKLFSLGDERLAALLKTINVRTLVSEQIDGLDMFDVERIVLDVMANQFKWINLFGGILGGLIGLFQALLSRLQG
ncbi:MAG: DUF445 family protein [Treponema sp.]|jgi:uncharacterized membrane protein YheB (UPF0754 family)|nr:DUF445 family protein [Treponema sp.]